MELFTVDRLHTLREGAVYDLEQVPESHPAEIDSYLRAMYPEGLSHHGRLYLLSQNPAHSEACFMLELYFEQVRRAFFPNMPSRFQSMFAVDNADDALAFKKLADSPSAAVYRIHCESASRVDMSLINSNNSMRHTAWNAHQYWSGEAGGQDTFWEWLMPLPVRVGERVG